MRRIIRIAVVGVLIMALTLDSAAACHLFGRIFGGGRWCRPVCHRPRVAHYHSCPPVKVVRHGPCDDGVVSDEPAPDVVHERSPADRPMTEAPAPPPSERARVQRPVEFEPPPTLPMEPPAEPRQPVEPLADEPESLPWDDVETPTVPAEEEDVFAPPREVPTEPAEPTVPDEPTEPVEVDDDIFGTLGDEPMAEPAEPAEVPADEPLEEPMEQPADAPREEGGLFDDFFGTAPTTEESPEPIEEPADEFDVADELEPADEQPADEQPTEEPADEETDDLFDFFGGVLREPGGAASDELREWVDNTGRYACRARLIRFLDGQVRLLKDNGRTTTVPLYRLSPADLEFVHRQQVAFQGSTLDRTAQAAGLSLPAAN